MPTQHSIEVIVNVDGQRVHRMQMDVEATGLAADALGGFDPAAAAVRALRQEANRIEEDIERAAYRQVLMADHQVIDADPSPAVGSE